MSARTTTATWRPKAQTPATVERLLANPPTPPPAHDDYTPLALGAMALATAVGAVWLASL